MFERNGALIQKKFQEYLLPTLVTSISVALSNVVNSILVGNLLGEAALSAVGLSGPVVYCINAIFWLFAVGGMTCALVAKGRRLEEEANAFFTLTFAAGLAMMVVLTILILIFLGPITHYLANGHLELQRLTAAFLGPLSLVGPLIMLVLGMAQFVRADGFPGASARIAIISNVANLIAVYILIEFVGLGIAGAGWSMVIGYAIGGLTLIPYLRSPVRNFCFSWPKKEKWHHLLSIARIGAPKALVQVYNFLRTLILNMLIVGISGPEGVAALAICLNALMLTSMFISGTNDTLLPIVGILFGERDFAGIRFAMRTGFKVLMAASFAMVLIFEFAPSAVGELFGIKSEAGMAIVVPALRLYAFSLPLYGINFMMQNFFQTTGRVNFASLITTLNGFVCVIFFALLLSRLGGPWIWLAFLFSEAVTFGAIFFKSRSLSKKEGTDSLFLLPQAKSGPELDVTIKASESEAVGLSEMVVRFCQEHGVGSIGANKVGLAVEEMAVNIARYSHTQGVGRQKEPGSIDILVRFDGDSAIVRLRDDGLAFDPSSYQPPKNEEPVKGGIDMLQKLAVKISYARQLGFNSTIATVPRGSL
jgi:Na+-driven multidrug efflux pump/anti-sigma regulatory factor (Ser/Thr protein kinase)